VTLKYKGYFLDKAKTKFDEGQFSYTIGSGGLIVGFDNALTKMRVGEKITAIIPTEKAYGAQGSGSIPPYTPIAFDIEIVSKN
jgi:FKBP-type peptidyl-prolyl cis-trans isomerase